MQRRALVTRQDALAAAGALAGGLLLLSAGAYVRWTEDAPDLPGWRLVTLGVLCVAMLFRRSRPWLDVAVAIPALLADLALGVSVGAMVIYSDSLYAATLYGRGPAGNRLLAAAVAGTALPPAG